MITIPRRMLLAGLASVALATVPKSGRRALADTALEDVSVKTPSGRTVSAVLAVPATVPAPSVLLIHGSGGLSDLYKSWAMEFAKEGFVGLAVDLYGGQPRTDDAMGETLVAWIEWLKGDGRTNGKVGIVGWSFGAKWALKASLAAPVEATVMYVSVTWPRDELTRLKGPVLGHFGERDPSTSKSLVEMFEARMKEAGKSAEVHWYAGDHYFPFPPLPSYDKKLADTAWTRTVDFFRANLR